MAHNIHLDELSGQYAFYSKKEIAWHGLGQVITECITPFEAMKQAHLDYNVAVEDAYVSVGGLGSDTSPYRWKAIPNCRATFRQDTGSVFGAVGSRYTVVQNAQFLDFIYDIFKRPDIFDKNMIELQTAGALGLGEKVFITAKVPGFIKLRSTGDDVAETYILVTSTHDGSGMFTAGLTNIRVVCNNTLNAALPGLNNKVTFKHTKSIKDNLREGASLMGLTHKWNEQQVLAYDAMAKVQLNEKQVIEYTSKLIMTTEQFAALKDCQYELAHMTEEQISTKMRNKVYDALNWIDKGEGQREDAIRGSVFWVYQGYNGYLNNGIIYDSQEDKFNSLTDGRALKQNQVAFDAALALI